jgi:hypothetical protein
MPAKPRFDAIRISACTIQAQSGSRFRAMQDAGRIQKQTAGDHEAGSWQRPSTAGKVRLLILRETRAGSVSHWHLQ